MPFNIKPESTAPELNVLVKRIESQLASESEKQIHDRAWWLAFRIYASILGVDLLIGIGLATVALIFLPAPAQWVITPFIAVALAVKFWNICRPQQLESAGGVVVQRAQAPLLFELIDEVSAEFDGVEVHEVKISNDYNAGAVRFRFARHAFQRTNSLFLGIFLLHSLSASELRGTLAHEMSHYSDVEMYKPWIRCAMSASWNAQFMLTFKFQKQLMSRLHKHLWALQLVLGKRNEFIADQAAARFSDPKTEAISLLRMGVVLHLLAKEHPLMKPEFLLGSDEPPRDMTGQFNRMLQQLLSDPKTVRQAIDACFIETHSTFEIHPTYQQRLESLNFSDSNIDDSVLRQLMDFSPSAATLLGGELENISAQLNADYFEKERLTWRAYYEFHKGLREHLLNEPDVKSADDAWQHFHSVAAQQSRAAAEPWLQKVLEYSPEDDLAKTRLAQIHLKRSQLNSIPILHSMLSSRSLIAADRAYEDLVAHYSLTGNDEALFQVERHWDELQQRRNRLHYEKQVTSRGTYRQPDLSSHLLERLRIVFERVPAIAAVHAGRKQLEACVDTRFLVFVVTLKQFRFSSDKLLEMLQEKMAIGLFEFKTLFGSPFSRVSHKIKRLPDSEIYVCNK